MNRRPAILLIEPWRRAGFIDDDAEILSDLTDVTRLMYDGSASRLLRRVRQAQQRNLADLCIAWFAVPAYIAQLALLCRVTRTPLVVIAGGVDVAVMPEIAFGLTSARARLRVRVGLRLASLVAPFSLSAENEVRRLAGSCRTRVMYPAIDTEFYTPGSEAARRPIALTVATVGRDFILPKGLDVFASVAEAAPDIQFVIAGRCVDREGERFAANLPSNVSVTNRHLSRGELRNLYRSARWYIQTSRHEGFGVACAEAMACGAIPIVHNTKSLPEVVGPVGRIVDGLEPKCYVAAIRDLWLVDDALRIAASERIVRLFNRERRSASFSEILNLAV